MPINVNNISCTSNVWTNISHPGFEVEVIADSISPVMKRIITMRCKFPRSILAEVNTHRVFSRNSASSRAIPVKTFISNVLKDPYIPVFWGKNQKGMSSGEELTEKEIEVATKIWLDTLSMNVVQAKKLSRDDYWVDESGELVFYAEVASNNNPLAPDIRVNQWNLNVYKETVNRLLEPFLWHTALITSTEWANFFALRTHPKTTAPFRILASLMADAYIGHSPKSLEVGEWHIPYKPTIEECLTIKHQEINSVPTINEVSLMISAGRCARVSYLTPLGKKEPIEDVRLHDDLILRQNDPSTDPAHGSPLEHQARAMNKKIWSGNFCGWEQYRKTIPYENITEFEWRGFKIGFEPTQLQGKIT